MSSTEKTEKPTAQKKRDARREGRIPRTPDLGSWGGLLAATTLLPMVARNTMDTSQRLMLQATSMVRDPDPQRALALLGQGGIDIAIVVAPLAGALLLVGVGAAASQGGLNFATKLLRPDFKRINPLSGLKKTFGPSAWWEGAKATVKTAVLASVLYFSLRTLFPALLTGGATSLANIIELVSGEVLTVVRTAALAGLVMAAFDYAVARRRVGRQLRMTKQEVKDEHKRQEGDPMLRMAIRNRQMEMSRRRMMADLAKADVVLVNPTHVAVALRYDPGRGAPRVVAKGAGAVAAKIREVAAEHRIPMVRDVALARALHKSCELGDEIPAELYTAVARVLAFVLTLKARGSAAGLHRSPLQSAA